MHGRHTPSTLRGLASSKPATATKEKPADVSEFTHNLNEVHRHIPKSSQSFKPLSKQSQQQNVALHTEHYRKKMDADHNDVQIRVSDDEDDFDDQDIGNEMT